MGNSTEEVLKFRRLFFKCPFEIITLILELVLLSMDYCDGDESFWYLVDVERDAPRTKLVWLGDGAGEVPCVHCLSPCYQVHSRRSIRALSFSR